MKVVRLNIKGSRDELRKQLVSEFLNEEPGTGAGDKSSQYKYIVEELENGDKIYLKRPAPLNKGFDFEVHAENIQFKDKGSRKSMPSHENIINDLTSKKYEDSNKYRYIADIINKIYRCEEVLDEEYKSVSFKCGKSTECILKLIKWLFIEQDITYWNFSGRYMLYSKLKEEELC